MGIGWRLRGVVGLAAILLGGVICAVFGGKGVRATVVSAAEEGSGYEGEALRAAEGETEADRGYESGDGVRIVAEEGSGCDVWYLSEEGVVAGMEYRYLGAPRRWSGHWSSAIRMTRTRYVEEDGVVLEETTKIPAFDEMVYNAESGSSGYSEDYYVIQGAVCSESGGSRSMSFDPEPGITEIVVVYEGEEYTIPFTVRALLPFSAQLYRYGVMLRDESVGTFYNFLQGDEVVSMSGEYLSENRESENRFDVLNYYAVEGYSYDWVGFEPVRVVSGSRLESFYGMEAGTVFDASALRPVAQAQLLFRTGEYEITYVEGTVELSGEVMLDEVTEGYELKASDDGRVVTGRLVLSDGSEESFSVRLAVSGRTIESTFTVSVPAALTLSAGESGFVGLLLIEVGITSEDEDFTVSVVPENGVLRGESFGEEIGFYAVQTRRDFHISDVSMNQDGDTYTDMEMVTVETVGIPQRADTYSGILYFIISSGGGV